MSIFDEKDQKYEDYLLIKDRDLSSNKFDCIILDLDETLVHSRENMEEYENLAKEYSNHMELFDRIFKLKLFDVEGKIGEGVESEMWGVMRPHLAEFLVFCFSFFKVVAIWSAGKKRYVEAVVDKIFRQIGDPNIILSREHCKSHSPREISKPILNMANKSQNLSQVMRLDNTIIVDDRSTNFKENESNGILIPEYSPGPNFSSLEADDICLLQLKYWITINLLPGKDVRIINKSMIFNTSLSDYQKLIRK